MSLFDERAILWCFLTKGLRDVRGRPFDRFLSVVDFISLTNGKTVEFFFSFFGFTKVFMFNNE